MNRLLYFLDFVLAPLGAVGLFVWHPSWLILPGFIAWTLIEYMLHRLAHVHPKMRAEHWVHHQFPLEITGPTSFHTLVIFGGIFSLGWFVFSLSVSCGVVSGLLAGYATYLHLHLALHRREINPGHVLYKLKARHVVHHESGEEKNFGVITSAWDKLFRS